MDVRGGPPSSKTNRSSASSPRRRAAFTPTRPAHGPPVGPALVLGDLAAEGFGAPLDLLGRDHDPGQLAQQDAALNPGTSSLSNWSRFEVNSVA
jgi:hypothetical protein